MLGEAGWWTFALLSALWTLEEDKWRRDARWRAGMSAKDYTSQIIPFLLLISASNELHVVVRNHSRPSSHSLTLSTHTHTLSLSNSFYFGTAYSTWPLENTYIITEQRSIRGLTFYIMRLGETERRKQLPPNIDSLKEAFLSPHSFTGSFLTNCMIVSAI